VDFADYALDNGFLPKYPESRVFHMGIDARCVCSILAATYGSTYRNVVYCLMDTARQISPMDVCNTIQLWIPLLLSSGGSSINSHMLRLIVRLCTMVMTVHPSNEESMSSQRNPFCTRNPKRWFAPLASEFIWYVHNHILSFSLVYLFPTIRRKVMLKRNLPL
jgi:hypothetical protein